MNSSIWKTATSIPCTRTHPARPAHPPGHDVQGHHEHHERRVDGHQGPAGRWGVHEGHEEGIAARHEDGEDDERCHLQQRRVPPSAAVARLVPAELRSSEPGWWHQACRPSAAFAGGCDARLDGTHAPPRRPAHLQAAQGLLPPVPPPHGCGPTAQLRQQGINSVCVLPRTGCACCSPSKGGR